MNDKVALLAIVIGMIIVDFLIVGVLIILTLQMQECCK